MTGNAKRSPGISSTLNQEESSLDTGVHFSVQVYLFSPGTGRVMVDHEYKIDPLRILEQPERGELRYDAVSAKITQPGGL